MKASDADLVRRLQDDDPTALEEAYRLFSGRCTAIARNILRDDCAAADAVQETFLSLWTHRSGLVVRTAGLGPWLSVVTRNAALTMLRKRTAREHHEILDDAPDPAAVGLDPAEVATRGQASNALRHALQRLPAEQQNVLQLAYFHFLTLSQIADRTHTPLGTVKRRAQRALQQLRTFLQDGEATYDPSV